LQRISISEDDLGGEPGTRAPAVYAPVGGQRHPEVYGPADADRAADVGMDRSRVPAWLVAVGAALLVLAVGLGAFLVGRGGTVSDAELQRQLSDQRTALTQEAEQSERQAVRAAVQDAEREAASARRSAVSAARASGYQRGFAEGKEEGLQLGRGETCTGLVC
jgi:hypothetical protein